MFENTKDTEVVKHGMTSILRINYLGKDIFPTLADDATVMRDTIQKIIQNPSVTKVLFIHNKNYEHSFEQVQLLREIGNLYIKLTHEKDLFLPIEQLRSKIGDDGAKIFFSKYTFIQNTIVKDLLSDPISAYVKLKRELRDSSHNMKGVEDEALNELQERYLQVIKYLITLMESLVLIHKVKDDIAGHKVGSRDKYVVFFQPNIKPNFVFTSLQKKIPINAKEIESYDVVGGKVRIFSMDDEAYNLYHLTPVEFDLNEEKYQILNLAKEVLAEHAPQSSDFISPQRLREVFFNISKDLVEEIAQFKQIELKQKDSIELAEVLIRYTVGFGLIETLLSDENVQDISINSPANKTPIFLTHASAEDCRTNIIPEQDEVEGWASRLRMISGKPLDASNPLLDTEIETPMARARVSAIGAPLNPYGLGFSFRRHRDKPWTLLLFMKNKAISTLAAGVLSFIIDGARTMLIAGTRGSGKSSILSAVLVEIMRKYRIITIEDTLEIPTLQLTDLGYNIQAMTVKSALSMSSEGFSADMGIRSTLRLGDSCLIVGEVRSTEALALYEAMRVGALANVVAGTIHGDSPYGVYDRLVNDLGVPKTSFKATDLVIVANPVKSSDGLQRMRRITQITEIRKNWEEDPELEGGFVDLFKYNAVTDTLEISDDLMNGDSELLKAIGANVKQWSGNWDAIWDNIELRANIKQLQIDVAEDVKCDELLEAKCVIDANDQFHKISQRVNESEGFLDSKKIFREFDSWYRGYAKKVVEEEKLKQS
ncbi:MAG: type II/IV secretion system ATPase subunit [Nanoarchaeota archaeon]|nr:type II/IV secretion system ATPase subunit [Nanoarchaeota archaeon]